MSLRLADVERLQRQGHSGFYTEDDDGYLQLRNVDGHCVFLQDGQCTVYPWRPEGCVLYPLILYTDCDEVGLHGFCPHRHEFRFSIGDEQWLRRGIAKEDAEAEARRRLRGAPIEPP
jgi:Fe-S-cluster containining protein